MPTPPTVYPVAQDAIKGEQIFKQCMICHRIGESAKNLIGPVLNNVIGRQAGTGDVVRFQG